MIKRLRPAKLVAALASLALALGTASTAEADPKADYQLIAIAYEDTYYGGEAYYLYGPPCKPYSQPEYINELYYGWNDQISSIDMNTQHKCFVVLFEHTWASGARKSIRNDVADLGDWNDRTSSLSFTLGQ
ncbi:hypothetical protein [Streptomyces clavuligerus]|uniref:Beta/gamma crystallin 'Greek key' domain-containing protein n=2 Tax=Streptomyces clavuligerus TaxID=1901 RepID=E2PZY3_STRCL|nr:hypothetical protein [Streptomyces clavuligerus]ANW18895.1 hypothetical protein BB341_11965 [Streptomyces clavuligerus]AXU13471.1 hypothetical protein D1794_12395 [Streptomyces clavuligerus]EFG08402.1 Hypothetical protein SCLAV_3331 [Streptomyces clavuligerus]MBY6303429.1 hypothetical protein [Streptomyces clavuligerus]QCS06254.1 hypothetical protein CRV15_11830 [Streptomyces clavuligerus]